MRNTLSKKEKRRFMLKLAVWAIILPLAAVAVIFAIIAAGFPEHTAFITGIQFSEGATAEGNHLAAFLLSPLGITAIVAITSVALIAICVMVRAGLKTPQTERAGTRQIQSGGRSDADARILTSGDTLGETSQSVPFEPDPLPKTVPLIRTREGYTPAWPKQPKHKTPSVRLVTEFEVTDTAADTGLAD